MRAKFHTGTHFAIGCLSLALTLAALGCGAGAKPDGAKVAPDKGSTPLVPAEKDATAQAPIIDLRSVDIDGYNAEIAKHKGKVILVDFWATWCGPCTKQFPHTVELHQKFGRQGLDVVALSFDSEDQVDAVKKFLVEQRADFTNLRSEYDLGPECAEKFEFEGALPHYRVYDRSGKLVKSWDGGDPEIEQKIEELLKAE